MGEMRRGKRPKGAVANVDANQCQWCTTFYEGPENHAKGYLGHTPRQLVKHRDEPGRAISGGYCGPECASKPLRRYHHEQTNERLAAEGYEPVPLPDELKPPWEIDGRPMTVTEPWEPPAGSLQGEGEGEGE